MIFRLLERFEQTGITPRVENASMTCVPTRSTSRFALSLFTLTCCLISGLLVQTTPAYAQTGNELIKEADLDFLKRKKFEYTKALSSSSLTQAEITLLTEYNRIQVLQMSLKSQIRELSKIREQLKRDLNLLAKPPARAFVLPLIIKYCEQLLIDQPLPVRLNACLLITELNEEPPNVPKQIPATPFTGMADPLIAIISDKNQSEALKIIATNGLMRLCQDGNPKVDIRSRVADALIEQLKQPNLNEWYKRSLVEAVSHTSVLFDKTRTPYIVQTLAEILINPMEPWTVRAEAASGLGRTEMNREINLTLVNYEIVNFAHEMGQQFNAKPNAPHWRLCAFRVYTAYQPEISKSTALLTRIKNAPFSTNRAEVQEAYDVVLPLANEILKQNPPPGAKAVPVKVITDLKTWLDANTPENYILGPNTKPLRNPKP
ncbi:MAG: hypothetical protein CMN21_06215 [Rubinisphaera sp.]|nr:hypothetical protein [Rubinisphaera sp.]